MALFKNIPQPQLTDIPMPISLKQIGPTELRAKDYLRIMLKKQPWGVEYEIKVPWGLGDKIIARVRTELSRLRNEVRKQKGDLHQFKLLTQATIGENAEEGDTIKYCINDESNQIKRELSTLAKMIVDAKLDGETK